MSELIGKRLLVGITYVDADGAVTDQVQFVGVVIGIDPVVRIEREGSNPFQLPATPSDYYIAEPGEYRLRSTGELVVNPDFVTTWKVIHPRPEEL
jgi:hypothetical protein